MKGVNEIYTKEVHTMAKKTARGTFKKHFMFEGVSYYAYGKTSTEAEQAKAAKIAELKAGVIDRENPRLNAYYETFAESRRGSVKESTLRAQRSAFTKLAAIVVYNDVTLGEMRIRDIKAADLKAVQKALLNAGNSTCTTNDNMSHLSHVFNAAIKDEVADRNPCISLTRVRRTEPLARNTKHRALNPEELKTFMAAATENNSYFLNLFKLMLNTGLRIGEVGALTMSDIYGGYIHVTKTVTRYEDGTYNIGEPKTRDSIRDIPINDTVKQILKAQQELNALIFGNIVNISEPLFKSPEGGLLKEYTVNREIQRLIKNTDVEHFTSHAFRETFASMFMDKQPELFKTLSEIMGHSNTSITLDLYTHSLTDTKIKAMNAISIAL